MKNILLFPLIVILNGAWHSSTQIGSTMMACGENCPLSEKDTAYLFCESDEEALRARTGLIDWRESSPHSYCDHKHGDADDSWRSGWKRSRLMRGCKSQLGLFGNKVYRCYDYAKDPAIVGAEQSYRVEQARMYDAWLVAYDSKVEALRLGAAQTFGDLDAQLIEADHKIIDQRKANELKKTQVEGLESAMESILEKNSTNLKTINGLIERFDLESKTFTEDLEALENDLEGIDRLNVLRSNELKETALEATALLKLLASWKQTDSESQLTCSLKTAELTVSELRDYIGFANRLNQSVLESLKVLSVPEELEPIRAVVFEKLRPIGESLEARSYIFDSHFDQLAASDAACEEREFLTRKLTAMTEIAQRIESSQRTVGVIADFEKTAQIIRQDLTDSNAKACVRLGSNGVNNRLYELIHGGEISQARLLANDIEGAFARVQSKCHENGVSQTTQDQMETVFKDARAQIEETITTRLNLGMVDTVLNVKMRRIKTKMMRKELEARKDTVLLEKWNLQKSSFLSELGITVGKDIPRPALKDWDEILEFDSLLGRVEQMVDAGTKGAARE